MNKQLNVSLEIVKRLKTLEGRINVVENKPSQVVINKIFNSLKDAKVQDGNLVLTMLDGKTFNAGPVQGAPGDSIAGRDGIDGQDGADGFGLDGKDGASVELVRQDNIIFWKNDNSDKLNPIISIDEIKGAKGKNGKDGKDGLDGCGITDITTSSDGNITIHLSDGRELLAGRINTYNNRWMGGGGGLRSQVSASLPIVYDVNTGNFTLNPLTVADFASPNVSQWTNDAGYITSGDLTGYVPYTGATSSVDLGAHSIAAESATLSNSTGTALSVIGAAEFNGFSASNILSYSPGNYDASGTQTGDGQRIAFKFVTGSNLLQVTAVAIHIDTYFYPTITYNVAILDSAGNSLGSGYVDTITDIQSYVYANLSTPITLQPNTTYWLCALIDNGVPASLYDQLITTSLAEFSSEITFQEQRFDSTLSFGIPTTIYSTTSAFVNAMFIFQQISATPLIEINNSGQLVFNQLTGPGLLGVDASEITQIVDLTGDVTTTGLTSTLATVNSNVGTFGSATQVGQFTVNGKGLVTAASNVTITGVAPGGSAGGDLSGTYPNPTVAKINGVALGSTTATAANLLIASGTTWVSTAVTGDVTITSGGVTAIGATKVTNAMLAGSIADSKLSTISTAGKVSNSATTATNLNTASAIVARDASGNFTAGTITAALSGNASTATSAGKWTTARNLAGNSVDGSANVAFTNKFIVQGTTDTGLSGAQFLGALSTGLVKNTITTGVLSIATAATDYVAPSAYASSNGLTMATSRLLGRTTALTGAAEEISIAGGLTLSGGVLTGLSGTVTSVSVVSANGFAGSVATATTTPAITLTTSITGILKGNGTAISAATSGTDYSAGTSALATGILKSTTTTGALTIAVAGDFPTLNQNTTGSAATLTTTRTLWGQNFNGSADVTGSLTSVGNITGGASSMTILAGTGVSRTLTFQTTTAGSVATTALTLSNTQSATFANTVNATTFVGALTGNATTATTLATPRTIGGVSFDGSAAIVPQTIQSINEATDTTCFPLFITASGTQSLQPLNNAGFIYNSSANSLTATTFIGALTGNASTATTAAAWTTARNLAGNSVNGSANVAFANKFIVQGTTDTGLSAAQFLGALSTGIVKNTTTTGVLSIAVAGDFPTLNQNTTGSAATLTTSRNLWGQAFNGSADVTGSLTSVGNITGGASSMTILAGTGASRTLTLQTTTAGSAATTALTLAADQSATFANTVNATTFVGALSGNATTATTATTASNIATANEAADSTCFLAFVTASGTQSSIPVKTNTGLTYDSTTNTLSATTFSGAFSGTITTANNVATANEASDTTCYPTFVTASGTQSSIGVKTNTSLVYNSSTNCFGFGWDTPLSPVHAWDNYYSSTKTIYSLGTGLKTATYDTPTKSVNYVGPGTGTSSYGADSIIGYTFTVGATQLYLTHLGHFQDSGLGIFTSGTRSVGLYNSGGTLVASATVSSGATLESNFVYNTITSAITLAPGTTWTIISTEPASAQVVISSASTTFNGITFGAARSDTGSSLAYTTNNALSWTVPLGPGFKYSLPLDTFTVSNRAVSITGSLSVSDGINVASGGTGISSYTVGDLLYASATTTLSKLADVAIGNALISGGVSTAPAWGKIGLTTHVSGTLPVANGGTGITSLGTGVATWLGTPTSANLLAAMTDETGTGSLVFATSPTLVTPALGTPASGVLTNCTGKATGLRAGYAVTDSYTVNFCGGM